MHHFSFQEGIPGARQEIAKHPGWRLWDRIDISREVRGLPDKVAAIRLVDSYFPGYREAFLGVGSPVHGRALRRSSGRSAACRCSLMAGDLSVATRNWAALTALFQDPCGELRWSWVRGGSGRAVSCVSSGSTCPSPGPLPCLVRSGRYAG